MSTSRKLLLTGFALVLSYWVLDATLDAAVFKENGSFLQSLFTPSSHRFVDRVLPLILVLSFWSYSRRAVKSRRKLEQAVEAALKKAEQERAMLEAVVEAMGDGISIQRPDLTILYQNRVHRQLVGSHVGELCHLAYRQLSEPCPDCHLQRAFLSGGIHRSEKERSGEHGGRCLEIVGSAARDRSGQVVAGVELVRDISERKMGEEALRKQSALLQHLIDTIPNPVYYQDTAGCFVWCNAAFAGWLGKPRELLIGRTIAEVAPHTISRSFQLTVSDRERGTVTEGVLQRGDGELRDVILYNSPFEEGEGEAGGVVVVLVDITQRKRAEQEIIGLNAALTQQALELQQVNRELEAFNHAISHDLRTPLTRISSYAQLLEDYADVLDENGLQYVRSVAEGCFQVDALLNALMGLSRASEVEMATTPVDLSRLAIQTARELELGEPERTVSFRIAPDLRATGDRALLQVALENLLRNAWKYTSKSDDALIELGSFTSHEGDTVFFVRDNGAGFDSARSDQLFKPFRRLHSGEEFPGNGLGLATVRRIIRRHNGTVWGEGAPGQGATFYFTVNS